MPLIYYKALGKEIAAVSIPKTIVIKQFKNFNTTSTLVIALPIL